MRDIGRPADEPRTPLGHRRGLSDVTRFALDLPRAGADAESAARVRSYPSPPMSGSPPLPPKASQEAAERIQGTYQTTTTTTTATAQDVYRGRAATQAEERAQTSTAPPRMSPSSGPERLSYGFQRHEGSMTRPLPYPQHQLAAINPPGPYQPVHRSATAAPLPAPQSYPAPIQHQHQHQHQQHAQPQQQHQAPQQMHQQGPESSRQSSPKPQRKTKGHVASACVPCKRAHLRCDAQRPCSRCMTNGKEDACIDVQHKKRGRPRLRDDRDAKFDGSRGFGSSGDAMRRPIPAATAFGQRPSMAESIAPRFPERALASGANIYPAPLSIPPRAPEPAAYLTFDFEFGNASTAFLESIARQSVKGLRLADVVAPGDRDRASTLHRQIQDERQRKDPTYLPPMFSRENADRVMQTLGFGSDELSRYAPEWQEHLGFMGHDGQVRQLSFRMGLTKVESIYIVVLWLTPARAFQYPTPSPNPREITYAYPPSQQGYSQPTPVSATFDARHSRPGDGGYGPRQGGSMMAAGLSPGMQSSYAASPNRPEYPIHPPYPPSRGEISTGGRPPQGPGPAFQLPPIRNQQPSPTQPQEPPYQAKKEERSRVDIGGLLDRPGPSNKPRQP